MWNASLEILGFLADTSVRALGLVVVAGIALAILRTRHAAARHAVWTAVLAGMLVLPALSPLLPPLAIKAVAPRVPASLPAFRASATPPHMAITAPTRSVPAPSVPVWPLALIGLYLIGVTASLARLFWAYGTCRRLVRTSALIRDQEAMSLLADVAAAQSHAWPLPQLRSSASVAVPMTVSAGEPVILFPDNWRAWDGMKLRAVLAHELAHIRRGDWLVTFGASLNRAVFWFNPLAWWLEQHLSALAEQASDDAALRCVNDAPLYARTVLDFAAALQTGRRLNYGVAMARTAKVSRRIDRILALRQPSPAVVSAKTWIAIAACALPLVCSVAALQLAQTPSTPNMRPGIAQLWTEGSKLTAAEAQQLEDHLARDPEDLAPRGKLISYYREHAMDAPRMQHLSWLVEHHPESEIAAQFTLGSELSSSNYENAKKLWLDQVTLHPIDAHVLANAASFLGVKDRSSEKDLLERARQLEPSNPEWLKRLADPMSKAIVLSLQIKGGTYFTAAPNGPITAKQDDGFGTAAIAELESSSDASLVGTVGEFISGGQPGGRPAPETQRQLAEHLLTRAQALDPSNQEWSAALDRLHAAKEDSAQLEPPKGTIRIRVGGNVQQSNLIEKPVPVYPPLAKLARIQGLVRFNVVIGKDGHIKSLAVVGGHPLLIAAAQEAVQQWVYRPTLLNGDPVEVTTVIDVQFTLSN